MTQAATIGGGRVCEQNDQNARVDGCSTSLRPAYLRGQLFCKVQRALSKTL